MSKDWIFMSPCAQRLGNFHSEVRKTMKLASQVLSQDQQHPPQNNINSTPRESPLKNKGVLSSQQKPSRFRQSHSLFDNPVSTQKHHRQLWGEGAAQRAPRSSSCPQGPCAARDLSGTKSLLGHTEKISQVISNFMQIPQGYA